REFNTALLGKWCWRLLVDRDELWYRVLAARYSEVAGRLVVGGQRGSSKIRDGENADGGGVV
ncbi:non-LTR retrotransposon transposase, partial [Trifolium medium]|nr:non-LTR retrotransposon transposase [Trifolium medium]